MPVVKLRTRAPLERTDSARTGAFATAARAWARFACLLLMLSVAAGGPSAFAAGGATLETVPSSNYTALRGQSFFLLSDASFGSDQVAQVRLEAPGREYKAELQQYGGADILVYRVENPLAFLKAQKNLHRLDVKADYRGEGMANTLSYLWDNWYKKARRAWQRVLSFATRSQAVEDAPQFSMGDQIAQPTRFESNPQFAPLKGYPLVSRFRYPIWDAKEIEPPKGARLEGSSSEFLPRDAGNVMVPLGRLKPGLYIVEGIIGSYRAHTLLFISDTVAVIKSTAGGMLVWAADRRSGRPVAGASVAWSDGLGVLQSAGTGADGIAELKHASPERSYLLGQDADGGVFISESFYYDSEIYNTKLYAFTDRPLYRPGDEVRVKFMGRDFRSANESAPAAAGDIKLAVLDPNGAPIATLGARLTGDGGADVRFALPDNALAGGYTLRFDYGGNTYGGAFRVAEYIKPHFDINLALDKADYATGETVRGKIQLRYPDGKPVKAARLSVTLRAQQVTMVEGELRYAGMFPLKLEQQELVTDGSGNAALTLPPAKDPSRYVLTVFANDGAAYRVKVTRELLIARGATPYKLTAPANFTNAGQSVTFELAALAASTGAAQGPAQAPAQVPAKWELLRLESRSRTEGKLGAAANGVLSFPVRFEQPGSYTLSVKDAAGNLLAAASHWVAGDGLQTVPGNIEIVFDRDRYNVGDTAEALVTFPLPVEDALLTLERDRVERRGLLSKGGDWLSLQKVTDRQWRARIQVGRDFSPNMTFSVLYVKDGDYVFQNAGIAVAQPAIALTVKSDKAVYAPGETVTLDLGSAFDGKPVPANLTVSVVDEMVYVLQPEIAPSIVDFFYHPRRNNVRTTSSLNFIGYDLAASGLSGAGGPERGRYNERGVKVLERPRRDEQDTAAWVADLRTDASGRARVTFTMPDSLTRWRITVRAMAGDGMVGQRTASIRSDKDLYLKWTGPRHYRGEDAPRIDMVVFNQGARDAVADLVVTGAGLNLSQGVTLKRGANYLRLPVAGGALRGGVISAELKQQGRTVDRLQTTLRVEPSGWLSPRELVLPLTGAEAALNLPADAQDVRLRLVDSAASQFARVADDLLDYPYGCAEQTASRLIPLALARRSLAAAGADTGNTTQGLDALLRTQRQRLALLAGVNGQFGWWGDQVGDSALLTAYAYYADWLASRAVGISLPPEHWKRTLDAYRQAHNEPLLHRMLALWFIHEMELPVATQLGGVAAELSRPAGGAAAAVAAAGESLVFAAPDSPQGRRVATVLAAQLYRQIGQPLPEGLSSAADAAREALAADPAPLVQSLLRMDGKGAAAADVQALLARASAASPTIDRAVALIWLDKALGGGLSRGLAAQAQAVPRPPQGGWRAGRGALGLPEWRWTGAQPPATLSLGAPQRAEAASRSTDINAVVSYRSRMAEAASLPIGIERRLYRLVPVAGTKDDKEAGGSVPGTAGLDFVARPVKAGDKLDSNTLYVDEIVLTPRQGAYRYGLLEVPLPPGGEVEGTTWGLRIDGLPDPENKASGLQAFQRATTYEMGMLSYHQPVIALEHPAVLRQLVRFSLPGRFRLPPARFFRMYQPEAKALQGDGKTAAYPLTVE